VNKHKVEMNNLFVKDHLSLKQEVSQLFRKIPLKILRILKMSDLIVFRFDLFVKFESSYLFENCIFKYDLYRLIRIGMEAV
jgi:hypothetical protein